MSVLNLGFLKKISDWVSSNKYSAPVNPNVIEIEYTRNFSSAFLQSLYLDHLDSDGNTIATDTLLSSASGTSHTFNCKVYGDYKIRITNEENTEPFYVWLNIKSEHEGYVIPYSAQNIGAGSTLTTPIYSNPSKSVMSGKLSDWVDRKENPLIDKSSIRVDYSHSQSATLKKSIYIEYLDNNDNILATDTLIDDKAGNSHTSYANAYDRYRIKVANNSGSSLNVTLKHFSARYGNETIYTSQNVGNGATLYSNIYDNVDKSNRYNKIYDVELVNIIGMDDVTISGTKRSVRSIGIDNKGNYILGGTDNRTPNLSKYDSSGNLLWSRDELFRGAGQAGNIVNLAIDSNNDIWVGNNSGSLYKIPDTGEYSSLQKTFGATIRDIVVGTDNSVYVCGNNYCRKYDTDGTLLWEYAVTTGPIRSVAIDSSNYVYVSANDGGQNKIIKLNQSSANDITPPTVVWSETLSYLSPKVRIDRYDNLYYQYNDSTPEVRKTTTDGSGFLTQITSINPNGSTSFNWEIDDEGFVYINNFTSKTIKKYSPKGTLDWTYYKQHSSADGTSPITIYKSNVAFGVWGKVVTLKKHKQFFGYSKFNKG